MIGCGLHDHSPSQTGKFSFATVSRCVPEDIRSAVSRFQGCFPGCKAARARNYLLDAYDKRAWKFIYVRWMSHCKGRAQFDGV